MTYRQIENSREARLWITQILFPVIIVCGMIFKNPEARCHLKNKVNDIKTKIKSRFQKD